MNHDSRRASGVDTFSVLHRTRDLAWAKEQIMVCDLYGDADHIAESDDRLWSDIISLKKIVAGFGEKIDALNQKIDTLIERRKKSDHDTVEWLKSQREVFTPWDA